MPIVHIIINIIFGLATIFVLCAICYGRGFIKGRVQGINDCLKILNNHVNYIDTIKNTLNSGDENAK